MYRKGKVNLTFDLEFVTLRQWRLFAGSGNDALYGDGGDDHLYGGAGQDTLVGGPGNDDIQSGSGLSAIYGGNTDGSDGPDPAGLGDEDVLNVGSGGYSVLDGHGYFSPNQYGNSYPDSVKVADYMGKNEATNPNDPGGPLNMYWDDRSDMTGPFDAAGMGVNEQSNYRLGEGTETDCLVYVIWAP